MAERRTGWTRGAVALDFHSSGGRGAPQEKTVAGSICAYAELRDSSSLARSTGQGRLRIYRNTGTNSRPVFDRFTWFKAGGRIACLPSG